MIHLPIFKRVERLLDTLHYIALTTSYIKQDIMGKPVPYSAGNPDAENVLKILQGSSLQTYSIPALRTSIDLDEFATSAAAHHNDHSLSL